MSLVDRLRAPGPKRILSLDGGGIRGAISLGILESVEKELKAQHGNDSLKLCEYFDLIIGTSTGSIIAGGLAIGMTVAEIRDKYIELGGKVFQKRGLLDFGRLKAWFKIDELNQQLANIFGDIRMGSPDIKTGICVVTKRADTGSTWPVINHEDGKFFEENKNLLLRQVIRASTAAPTFFEPEIFDDVGDGMRGVFVDGGVSMANNPSLQAFLIATLKGFPFHWKKGGDDLFLVSVGTGAWQDRKDIDKIKDHALWNWAGAVPTMLMDDANWQNQLLLQAISKCPQPIHIDLEVGDAAGDLVGDNPFMTYIRYEAVLDEESLGKMDLSDQSRAIELNSLRDMSDADNRHALLEIGQKAALRQVAADHFPDTFKVNKN